MQGRVCYSGIAERMLKFIQGTCCCPAMRLGNITV